MNNKINSKDIQNVELDDVVLVALRSILIISAIVGMTFGVVMFFTGSRTMSIFLFLFGLGTYIVYRRMQPRHWYYVSILIVICIEVLTIYSLIDGSCKVGTEPTQIAKTLVGDDTSAWGNT